MKEIFWLDGFDETAQGGFFVRSTIVDFFEKCESKGLKIVGIVKPENNNLEFILEINEKYKELYNETDNKVKN